MYNLLIWIGNFFFACPLVVLKITETYRLWHLKSFYWITKMLKSYFQAFNSWNEIKTFTSICRIPFICHSFCFYVFVVFFLIWYIVWLFRRFILKTERFMMSKNNTFWWSCLNNYIFIIFIFLILALLRRCPLSVFYTQAISKSLYTKAFFVFIFVFILKYFVC